jgi:transcriptional regulator with XRE-family HTH domain
MKHEPLHPYSSRTVLANNVKSARLARNLTQSELAALAVIDRNYLCDLEKGLRNPSLDIIERLAKSFGTNTAALLAPNSATVLSTPIDHSLSGLIRSIAGARLISR